MLACKNHFKNEEINDDLNFQVFPEIFLKRKNRCCTNSAYRLFYYSTAKIGNWAEVRAAGEAEVMIPQERWKGNVELTKYYFKGLKIKPYITWKKLIRNFMILTFLRI